MSAWKLGNIKGYIFLGVGGGGEKNIGVCISRFLKKKIFIGRLF